MLGSTPARPGAPRRHQWHRRRRNRVTPIGHFNRSRFPRSPESPTRNGVHNPVDAFVLSRLEREKIQPAPEADKRTMLRRVSIDLTGLPPTPEELKDSSTINGRTRTNGWWIVCSRHHISARRWARPWLDRARYADSDGYEKDWSRPFAWRYRQWVIDALNRDMPFDQFTIEQVAGDLLPGASDRRPHRNWFPPPDPDES